MLNLRNGILRDKHHVTRTQQGNFGKLSLLQHPFQVENACLYQIVIDSPEQKNLGMFRFMRKAARNFYRLNNGSIGSQLVLARFPPSPPATK